MAFRVIGHRGAAGYAPENTLPGFTLALRLGVDAVELDVHLSRDGVPVVLHDDTLDRTTNGSGPVAAASSADLKRLDAGAWFHESWRETRLPFLEEALGAVAGHVPVVIELKGRKRVGELVSRCVEAVESAGTDAAFSSFALDALEEAKRQAPHIPRAYLFSLRATSLPEALAVADALELTDLCPAASEISAEAVRAFHGAGYAVRAWGLPIHDAREMVRVTRDLIAASVDGCTADFPNVVQATAATLARP